MSAFYLRLITKERTSSPAIDIETLEAALSAAPGVRSVRSISAHPKGGYATVVEIDPCDLEPLLAQLEIEGWLGVL